jgi:hypothetical protein
LKRKKFLIKVNLSTEMKANENNGEMEKPLSDFYAGSTSAAGRSSDTAGRSTSMSIFYSSLHRVAVKASPLLPMKQVNGKSSLACSRSPQLHNGVCSLFCLTHERADRSRLRAFTRIPLEVS